MVRRAGSRWTRTGLPVIFTSGTLSLAALERFVHADPDLEPPDLVAVAVDIDPSIAADFATLTTPIAEPFSVDPRMWK